MISSLSSHIARLLALISCALAVCACGEPYRFRGTMIDPPNDAPDFTLTDHRGQLFQLSEQRGKVVALYFGFTSCPDICPTTLADLAAVRRELGTDAEELQVALITVDPERDTQERLARYVPAFDPTFIGLRPTPDELAAVLKAYGATAIKRELPNSALGYTMDHSGFIYVIDAAGRWREVFAHGSAIADITNDLRELIRTGAA
jgi:protein SCO1/2